MVKRHVLGVAAAALFLGSHAAWALDGCPGSYGATSLQPLPSTPPQVALDVLDDSPGNVALGQSFTTGLQTAGVQVAPMAQLRLGIIYNVLGGTSSAPDGDASWDYSDNSAFQGGVARQLPSFSGTNLFGPGQAAPAQPPILILRVEIRDGGTNALYWVGMVRCTMQNGDSQKLAFDLGVLIGGTAGRSVARAPL